MHQFKRIRRTVCLLVFLLVGACAHQGSNLVRQPQAIPCVTPLAKVVQVQTNILPPAEVRILPPGSTASYQAFLKEPSLTIATYNMLNLNTFVGSYKPDPVTGRRVKIRDSVPKSLIERSEGAKAIREINPAILFMQEVEGEQSLLDYATKDLKGQWRPLTMKGNDGRGIQIAVLVRNDIPLKFEYESHRDEPWSNTDHPGLNKVFSRDLPALLARPPNGGAPLFILLGVHNKSKRTENTRDPESNQVREAKAERTVDIIKYYEALYPQVPIFTMGDFNGEANTEAAYDPLRKFGLEDAFALVPNPIPAGDLRRVTHTYHPQSGPTKKTQLDAVLVNTDGKNLILDASVYRYKNSDGSERKVPDTFQERQLNPSDHFPVAVKLDLQKMLKKAGWIQ